MDKKKLLIGTLCALIMIMALGYALLAQTLTINGTANITSTWKIEITNITQKEKSTGATEKSKSYDALTANFDVGFTSPGDYIIYEVEVSNNGTLDAVIERINVVTDNNPAIIYTTSGIKRGDVIEHNSKKYLTVRIEYDSSVTSQPQVNDSALTLQLFTEQNLGQVPSYETYSIGDKITFAGSDWYVIKNSTEDEDYLVLLKEKELTIEELGSYARESYGETYSKIYYNYNKSNQYSGSRMEKFFMEKYINDLGEENLKDFNGYKIRLITLEELIDFGYTKPVSYVVNYYPSETTPTWIYQDFGNDECYWTMSPVNNSDKEIWLVCTRWSGTQLSTAEVGINNSHAVRPVINLLKSAIE